MTRSNERVRDWHSSAAIEPTQRRDVMHWATTTLVLALFGLGVNAHLSNAQTLESQLMAEAPDALLAEARRDGDAVRGAAVFYSRILACSTCHAVGDGQNTIGPDLTKPNPSATEAELVEALLLPSKTIAAEYATTTIITTDGRVLVGLVEQDTAEQLILRDAAMPDKRVSLAQSEIEERRQTRESIMPAGQVNQLANRGQFLDLMRYLIELREGGVQRARQLQPPPDPLAQTVPDVPLSWRPVVQRGEVEIPGLAKFPHAVALGFVGGTAAFDADQLRVVGVWNDGFVRSSPQSYFGLYWHAEGTHDPTLADEPSWIKLRDTQDSTWASFEASSSSDPNTGTRFDGYQIGRSSVRLHYRLRFGSQRIQVTEDVRVDRQREWQGITRELVCTGLPPGAQVSIAIPAGSESTCYAQTGDTLSSVSQISESTVVSYQLGAAHLVARGQTSDDVRWESSDGNTYRLVSRPADADGRVALRMERWRYEGAEPSPSRAALASLMSLSPVLNDHFDAPRQPAQPLPEVPVAAIAAADQDAPARPAVQARQNIDEFPPIRARMLRFVVTDTIDDAEPGLDELEIYGPASSDNLALSGTATASSVIAGYSIHQIPHLNDGELGNEHSWISAERAGGWAQIEFAEPVEMNKIVWARDRTGISTDRLPAAYRVEVSDDGQNWVKVSSESGRMPPSGAPSPIRPDASPGYVMESIPLPFPACRPSDIVFDDQGTLYAIAMTEGQIWRTRIPPAGEPQRVQWHRYASGLYHPIGLALVDGRLYVAQKPEITELIDRDGDGTVDHYRTVATGWGLSTGWHEYCFGLAVDPQKNLWFALNTGNFWTHAGFVNPGRWRGSILRIDHGTETLNVVATGCRVPNGIAQGPGGGIFFTDNQGDWIQSCKLAHVVPGRFYGHPETREDALPEGIFPTGRSAVWMPYDRCRSISGPVMDTTGGQFGPFADQLFVGDVGYGANPGLMRVALEQVNGEYQGACFRFVDGQPHGCQRMRMGPDHQLYQASLATGLTRMKYTGDVPFSIQSVHIRPRGQGFTARMTRPLAEFESMDPSEIRVKRYHYLYTGEYGSPQANEQMVSVERVELSEDRTMLTLTFPVESYPIGMVYEIDFGNLTSDDGQALVHPEAWYTVHEIPE